MYVLKMDSYFSDLSLPAKHSRSLKVNDYLFFSAADVRFCDLERWILDFRSPLHFPLSLLFLSSFHAPNH